MNGLSGLRRTLAPCTDRTVHRGQFYARDSVPIQRRRVYQQDFHDPVKHIL